MKIASVAEVKAKLSSYLKASEEGPIVVTRNGRAVALILTPEDEDDLERLVLAYSPRLRRILDASNRAIESGKGIPHETFWKDLEQPNKLTGTKAPAKRKVRA